MNGWAEIKNEKELLLKLFKSGHLNVPERANLPNGKVRESAATELILNLLEKFGWFPGSKQYPINDDGGQYIQIELRDGGKSFIHHNFEYRYMRFKHKIIEYQTINEAVRSYLEDCEREGLDGIKMDWDQEGL